MKEVNQKALDKLITKNITILSEFNDLSVLLTRNDGVILWANKSGDRKNHTLGALITGAWTATRALTEEIGAENINNTLTFGGSSDGIHVLPITLSGKRFAFSVLYKKVNNPAKLKLKFRLLKQIIEDEYDEKSKLSELVDDGKEKTKALFNNITDEEIDNLFTL